jgi:uncharacterized membrane protein YkoI
MKIAPTVKVLAVAIGLVIAILFAAPLVHAGDDVPDHERARAALEAGEIVPLGEILELAQAEDPGQPIEVELEREDGRWIYEVELITTDGRMVKTSWDAKSKKLLERQEGLRERERDD